MSKRKFTFPPKMANRIELVPLDDLVPYAKNARTHSEDQISQIAESIKTFGFNNPILVDKDKGIIAGHGRFEAAARLGLEAVPVVRLDHLTEAQKKAYIIADNKIAENAGWDFELLADELIEISNDDLDLDLLGFSDEELSELLPDSPSDGSSSELTREDVELYTKKIEAPTYLPTGREVSLSDLYDDSRYRELIDKIDSVPGVDPEVREFLRKAASRFITIDFENVAEFYASKIRDDETTRELFRDLALVIVDFNKAIEIGLVNLTERLNEAINGKPGD